MRDQNKALFSIDELRITKLHIHEVQKALMKCMIKQYSEYLQYSENKYFVKDFNGKKIR